MIILWVVVFDSSRIIYNLRKVVNLKQFEILTYDLWLSICLISQQFVFSKLWKGLVSKETLVPERGKVKH